MEESVLQWFVPCRAPRKRKLDQLLAPFFQDGQDHCWTKGQFLQFQALLWRWSLPSFTGAVGGRKIRTYPEITNKFLFCILKNPKIAEGGNCMELSDERRALVFQGKKGDQTLPSHVGIITSHKIRISFEQPIFYGMSRVDFWALLSLKMDFSPQKRHKPGRLMKPLRVDETCKNPECILAQVHEKKAGSIEYARGQAKKLSKKMDETNLDFDISMCRYRLQYTVCLWLYMYIYIYIYTHRMYDQHNRWVRRSSWKFWSFFLDHDFSILCAWLKKESRHSEKRHRKQISAPIKKKYTPVN